MLNTTNLSNTCRINKEGVFIYSGGNHLSATDLALYISKNEQDSQNRYMRDYDYYVGDYPILHQAKKTPNKPDNRIVANTAHYLVDTYNGYFMGQSPKIQLKDENGSIDEENEKLQTWLNGTNFIDKLAVVSKDVDIYGKAFMLVYQNENAKTNVAVTDPTDSFVIYDDEITPHLLAYVRYWISNDGKKTADVYYADRTDRLIDDQVETIKDNNIYGKVPAVEFYESEERIGVFEPIISLMNEYNAALSEKANQVQYFDSAYLEILGLDLGDSANITNNDMIYSPDADASKAKVGFLSKPDGDQMQEHMLDRISDLIYQISQVPNLKDQDFSGNSSGVALRYKLLHMQNKAANKRHQFKHGLRALFEILTSIDTIVNDKDAWKKLNMEFYYNVPEDLANDAAVAKDLSGIVSDQTLYSILPFVDNPQNEIKRVQTEQKNSAKSILADSNPYDFQKNDPAKE